METTFSDLLVLQKTLLFKNQTNYYRLEIWENASNKRVRGTLQSSQFFYKAEDPNQQFPVIESWTGTDFQMSEYSSDTELIDAIKKFINPPEEYSTQDYPL